MAQSSVIPRQGRELSAFPDKEIIPRSIQPVVSKADGFSKLLRQHKEDAAISSPDLRGVG
ncbi:MAG: hypothetical protein P8Z80_18815 [Pseudolabrys sp.]